MLTVAEEKRKLRHLLSLVIRISELRASGKECGEFEKLLERTMGK